MTFTHSGGSRACIIVLTTSLRLLLMTVIFVLRFASVKHAVPFVEGKRTFAKAYISLFQAFG